MKTIYTLFICTVLFTACENETIYEYPIVADEYIAFTIDGQETKLNSLIGQNQYYNRLDIYTDRPDHNHLYLTRSSVDGSSTMVIRGENLPIIMGNKQAEFNAAGYAPVTIQVRSSRMSGSIYCPHEEDGNTIEYAALFRFDDFTEAGIMSGTFMTDAAADNPVTLKDGHFSLFVATR